MIIRKNRELFLVALRVLAQCAENTSASADDLALLRSNARAEEKGMPIDELCCAFISRELAHEDVAHLKAS